MSGHFAERRAVPDHEREGPLHQAVGHSQDERPRPKGFPGLGPRDERRLPLRPRHIRLQYGTTTSWLPCCLLDWSSFSAHETFDCSMGPAGCLVVPWIGIRFQPTKHLAAVRKPAVTSLLVLGSVLDWNSLSAHVICICD
jgi:hypothetical protein